MEVSPGPSGATALMVIAGTGYDPRRRRDNHVLRTELDPDVIARIAAIVTDAEDDEEHAAMDWMEWPTVSLVFLAGKRVLAEYGVLSGAEWVRTSNGDKAVARAEDLNTWLGAAGASVR